MIEIGSVQELLYDQVKAALKNKNVDPDIKKMLACKYVYFMTDLRLGMKRRDLLKKQYREIIVLIEKG